MASESLITELAQVRQELEMFKTIDPRRAVEIAIGIGNERKKVSDAMLARDAAVQRLAEAYTSLRQKNAIIENRNLDPYNNEPSPEQLAAHAEIITLKSTIVDHEETIQTLKEKIQSLKEKEKERAPLRKYDDRGVNNFDSPVPGLLRPSRATPSMLSRCPSQASVSSISSITTENHSIRPSFNKENGDPEYAVTRLTSQFSPPALEAEETIDQRNKFLATIPLPLQVPDDTLKPIVLPTSMNLHEMLASAAPPLRTLLSNYKVLQQITTSWCPEREEHGYSLVPAFRCHTNPRVATAHRWSPVDVLARLIKPTECFYNRDGTWYYAGVYRAFRIDDLTTKEWQALSNDTVQALIKETLSGRKNLSPQNIYETSQLYAAGALKVACVVLQCVGFNKLVYQAVLDQAAKCYAKSTSGLGTGSTWNMTVGTSASAELTDEMAKLSLGGD